MDDTRQDRAKNTIIRQKFRVAPIVKKMVKSQCRRSEDSGMVTVKGRPSKIMGQTVERDLKVNGYS